MGLALKRALVIGPLALASSAGPAAAAAPSVKTDQTCYLVGNPIALYGSGFAANRTYDVTDDGVDFGQAKTDAEGGFVTRFSPGGLAAGVVQSVHRIDVTDGTRQATTTFTVTRSTGARFEATRGDPRALRAPFQAWGFGIDGVERQLYLHYIDPNGRPRTTVSLGRARGQCGYLLSRPRRFFPFTPGLGRWTLQIDSSRRYAARPRGPAARIAVVIRRG